MSDQTGHVQLPRRRNDVLAQMRNGDEVEERRTRATKAEKPSASHMARAAVKKRVDGENRVELDADHYNLLVVVAGIARQNLGMFERAAMPVLAPETWNTLRKALADLSHYYRSEESQVSDLLAMRDDLRCAPE